MNVGYDIFNQLGSYGNIQFQISSRKKKKKQIPESSRLEFLERFIVHNFALSDTENNIYAAVTTTGY